MTPSKWKIYRDGNIAKGLCPYCIQPKEPDVQTCAKHRIKNAGKAQVYRKRHESYRERHKQQGLCIYCTKPPVSGKVSCEYHLQRYKEVASQHRAKCKQVGICSHGGCKEKIYSAGWCLAHCMKQRIQQALRIAERGARGGCTSCANGVPERGLKTCPRCLIVKGDREHHRRRLRFVAFKAEGRCTNCGAVNLTPDKYNHCPACRKKRMVRMGQAPEVYEAAKGHKLSKYLHESLPALRRDKEALEWIKEHRDLFIDVAGVAMSRAMPLQDNVDYERYRMGHRRKGSPNMSRRNDR